MHKIKKLVLLFVFSILPITCYSHSSKEVLIDSAKQTLSHLNKLSKQKQELNLSFAPFYTGIFPSIFLPHERIKLSQEKIDGWGKLFFFNNHILPLGTTQTGNTPATKDKYCPQDKLGINVKAYSFKQNKMIRLRDLIIKRLIALSSNGNLKIYRGINSQKEIKAWVEGNYSNLFSKVYFTPSLVYAGRYASIEKLASKKSHIIEFTLPISKLVNAIKSDQILCGLELPGSTKFDLFGPIDSYTNSRYQGDSFFGAEIELKTISNKGKKLLTSATLRTVNLKEYLNQRKTHICNRWNQLDKEQKTAIKANIKFTPFDCEKEKQRELREFDLEVKCWLELAKQKKELSKIIFLLNQLSENQKYLKKKMIQAAKSLLGKSCTLLSKLDNSRKQHYFYHYTGLKLAETIRKQGFKFSGTGLQGKATYMASDPFSSSTYGKIPLVIEMDPQTVILDLLSDSNLNQEIEKLAKRINSSNVKAEQIIINSLEIPMTRYPNYRKLDTWFALKNLQKIKKILNKKETINHFKELARQNKSTFAKSYILKGILGAMTNQELHTSNDIKKIIDYLDSNKNPLPVSVAEFIGRGRNELLRYPLLARFFIQKNNAQRFLYLIGLQMLENNYKVLPWIYKICDQSNNDFHKLIAIKTLGRIGNKDSIKFLKETYKQKKSILSQKLLDEILENITIIERRLGLAN